MGSGVMLQAFGKYVLVRKLAEGGMAEIFLAKQVGPEGFERNVVIKRMHPQLSSSPEFVQMFLDEARLAARLSHPNIVAINDLGHTDGHHFIAMEYLSGEDLSAVIRQSRVAGTAIPLQVVVRAFIDACEGLQCAHDSQIDGRPLGIVHRDISPSNLFVTYGGVTKVLDFGIAKAASHAAQTAAGVVKGKFVYMSPEQAQNGLVDRRTDIWALGASLFEAVTHYRLFQRDNELAIVKALCIEPVPRASAVRPDLPEALDAIIARALDRDLAQRYPTCADLRGDLETFAASLPPLVGGVGGYLSTLFGPEHIRERSTVPTLASLRRDAGGVAPSAPVGPLVTEIGQLDGHQAATQLSPVAPARRFSGIARVAAVIALVGLGVVGGLILRRAGVPAAPVAVAIDAAPPPAPTMPAAAPPSATATPPPLPPTPVAPVAVAPAAPARPAAQPRVVGSLSAREVQQRIAARHAKILACFQAGRSSLTQKEGKVLITFTVAGSGRVTAARLDTPELAGTPIGSCIAKQIRAIEFPRSRDKELTISVPFLYRVTQ